MEAKNILVEHPEPLVALLTLNREKKLNTLDSNTYREIISIFENCKKKDIRVIILTGAGEKVFAAGSDIAHMQQFKQDRKAIEEFTLLGHKVTQTVDAFPGVVIAALNGYALGGGLELALSCDWIVATQNSKIGLPEVKLGVLPGCGGTQRLPRLIGSAYAKKMIFTGMLIDATKAHQIGLLTQVFSKKSLMLADCIDTAKTILNNSFHSIIHAKEAIHQGSDRDLEKGYHNEREHLLTCFTHPDQSEGMASFLKKRKPSFR